MSRCKLSLDKYRHLSPFLDLGHNVEFDIGLPEERREKDYVEAVNVTKIGRRLVQQEEVGEKERVEEKEVTWDAKEIEVILANEHMKGGMALVVISQ